MSPLLRAAHCALAVLLSASAMAQAPASPAAPPSVDTFFQPNATDSVKVSPSGRWMAIQGRTPGARANLKVIDLDGKEPARVVAMFSHFDVDGFRWVNDDWLVFGVSDENDKSGKMYGSGLHSVRRDGEGMRQLIKRRFDSAFQEQGRVALEPNNEMLGIGAPGSNEIVIGENHFDTSYTEYVHTSLRTMDVSTGATRVFFKSQPEPPVRMRGWLIDGKGMARLGMARQDDKQSLWWFDAKGARWTKIAEHQWSEAPFSPAYVDEQDRLFVTVLNPQTSLSELREFDIAAGKPAATALIALPGFDADADPIRDPGSNRIHGVRLLTDSRSVAWFSPAMRAIQAKVDALLPNRVNHVSCHPCASPRTVAIYSYSDTTPGDFLLYRPATDKFERVGAVRPDHPEKQMANLELYRTTTRDGADLPVWITKTEGGGPRPAVVLVHGGPWVRGTSWQWDPEAQFLASRGYVVIEPEYRGSTGFGDRHFRAGWKQWGQRMQDDVSDALRFAIGKGWVDPKRVCIAGASYGGYAALMGPVRDPGQYRCSVAWLGVTDPRLMYTVHWSDVSEMSKTWSMPQMIGDLKQDAAMLSANSPLEQAARLKTPVLLAYGGKDRRVPLVHGEKMRDALAAAGNRPEWVVYDDEGHGWARTATQRDFWTRVERFLATHLK
ncbi:MAG: alpha/beta fold hydrolase [Pseudomonadota bacterium]